MSKFICLCGAKFRKLVDGELHVEMHEDLADIEGFPRHKLFKQHWQVRFLEFMFDGKFFALLSIVCGSIINGMFLKHSNFSFIECLIEGICMGVVMARVFIK